MPPRLEWAASRSYPLMVAEIGLFPLPLVLLPKELVPLHIFEPRYRELVTGCLESGSDFGIVLSDGEGMRSLGTRATVVQVVDRLPDGRLNILVEGGARFVIAAETEGRAYLTAEVRRYADSGPDRPGPELERCVDSYLRLVEVAGARDEGLDLEPGSASFEIAGRVSLEASVKQELLAMRSERERLILVGSLLDEMAEGVARRREIMRRAQGNGRADGYA